MTLVALVRDRVQLALGDEPLNSLPGDVQDAGGVFHGYEVLIHVLELSDTNSKPRSRPTRTTRRSTVVANGYRRLDRDEWVRAVEKRSAALG